MKKIFLEKQIEKISKELSIEKDRALIYLAFSLITGKSVHDLLGEDITEGQQDKQIDLFYIDEIDEYLTKVTVLQVKSNETFSSNDIIHLRNGLEWIFERDANEIKSLDNKYLKNKILVFNDTLDDKALSNIDFSVYYISLGDTKTRSKEFLQEERAIKNKFSNKGLGNFDFICLGSEELYQLYEKQDRLKKKINITLNINYDFNGPSLLSHNLDDLKGYICTIDAIELIKILLQDNYGFAFDLNLRQYLGTKGQVNQEIINTCLDENSRSLFWFLNNGVTIVCDSCEFKNISAKQKAYFKLQNLQIVNGCQTASTLLNIYKNGQLTPEIKVLLRIYETKDTNLVNKIVITTNNQNRIGNRDLRSNDKIQVFFENILRERGYFFERKVRQYDSNSNVPAAKIISNEVLGQAFLSVALKKPSDGSRRKYKIWNEQYESIFKDIPFQQHLFSFLLCREIRKWIEKYKKSNDEFTQRLAKNGSYHVGRIASYFIRKTDSWTIKNTLEEEISKLENEPGKYFKVFEDSFTLLSECLKKSELCSNGIDFALKSPKFDSDISKELNKNKMRRKKNDY